MLQPLIHILHATHTSRCDINGEEGLSTCARVRRQCLHPPHLLSLHPLQGISSVKCFLQRSHLAEIRACSNSQGSQYYA